MKKFNRFQFDILLFLVLIVFQVVFNRFYLSRLHPFSGSLSMSDEGFLPVITYAEGSIVYLPIMLVLYLLLISFFAIKKPRRPSLYYGLGLVLVAQVNFWWGLMMIEGQNIVVENVFLPQLTLNDMMLAQDVTMLVLFAMMLIKLGVYITEIFQDIRLTYRQQQTKP